MHDFKGDVSDDLVQHVYTADEAAIKATNFGLPNETQAIIPMFFAPSFVSGFYCITANKVQHKFANKLNRDTRLNDGGVHFFSPGAKKVIALDDPVLALQLAEKFFKENPGSVCPIVLYNSSYSSSCWNNYDLDEVVVLMTKNIPPVLSSMRSLGESLKLRKTSKKELLTGSLFMGINLLLKSERDKAKNWEEFLRDYLLSVSGEKEGNAIISALQLTRSDLKRFLLCCESESEIRQLKSKLGITSESKSKIHVYGTTYQRIKEGGISKYTKNKRTQVSDADLRIEKIIEGPEEIYYEGHIAFMGYRLPFFEAETTLKTKRKLQIWLRKLAYEGGIDCPVVENNRPSWLDLCINFSSPKVYKGLSEISYEDGKLHLPGLTISPIEITEENRLVPIEEGDKKALPVDKKIVRKSLERFSASPTKCNALGLSGLMAVALFYTRQIYSLPEQRLVILGDRTSFAEELYRFLSDSLKLKETSRHGEPNIGETPLPSSISRKPVLEGLVWAMKEDCVMIPGNYKFRSLKDYDYAEDLLFHFVQFALKKSFTRSLPSKETDRFNLFTQDMKEYLVNLGLDSSIITFSLNHLFYGSFSRCYEGSSEKAISPAMKFFSAIHYAVDTGLIKKDDLYERVDGKPHARSKIDVKRALDLLKDRTCIDFSLSLASIMDSFRLWLENISIDSNFITYEQGWLVNFHKNYGGALDIINIQGYREDGFIDELVTFDVDTLDEI
jgi:hypothetical protein